MSIETNNTDSDNATNQTEDEREGVPDPERGCGHLEPGKAYLRSDLSLNGDLPAFVEFDEPILYKENRSRSYQYFPGNQFELSVTGDSGISSTVPEDEIHEHLDRLEHDRPTGTTAGEMRVFRASDMIMSVGKTHYPTAESFIEEAKEHGVNKAISVTSRNEPPIINPGRTKVYLIHPKAVETTVGKTKMKEVTKVEEIELPTGETRQVEYTDTEEVQVDDSSFVPGVIGYCYATRVIYTEDEDKNIPQYVQDYEAIGSLDVVKIGTEDENEDDIETEIEEIDAYTEKFQQRYAENDE